MNNCSQKITLPVMAGGRKEAFILGHTLNLTFQKFARCYPLVAVVSKADIHTLGGKY